MLEKESIHDHHHYYYDQSHHHHHHHHDRQHVLQDTTDNPLKNTNNNTPNNLDMTLSSNDFVTTNNPFSIFGVPPVNETDPLQQIQDIGIQLPSSCDIQNIRDLYQPPPFHESYCLQRTNSLDIHFGASNDMINLIVEEENTNTTTNTITTNKNNDNEDDQEYIIGLVATSITVDICFILFAIVIIILKLLGYKHVGFFSGHFV